MSPWQAAQANPEPPDLTREPGPTRQRLNGRGPTAGEPRRSAAKKTPKARRYHPPTTLQIPFDRVVPTN
jgi:hypothetical protein